MNTKGIGTLVYQGLIKAEEDNKDINIIVDLVAPNGDKSSDGLTTGIDGDFFSNEQAIFSRRINLEGFDYSDIALLEDKGIEINLNNNPIEIEQAKVPTGEIEYVKVYIDSLEEYLNVHSGNVQAEDYFRDHFAGRMQYTPPVELSDNNIFRITKIVIYGQTLAEVVPSP